MEKRDRAPESAVGSFDPHDIDVKSILGSGQINKTQLGPNAGLQGSNILFRDDSVGPRRRSWNERLFYGVGTTYLIGAVARACPDAPRGLGALTPCAAWQRTHAVHIRPGMTSGGVWGFVEGLRHPDGTTARLRINSVLNGVTRRGPFLGNSLGVLGTRPSRLAPA